MPPIKDTKIIVKLTGMFLLKEIKLSGNSPKPAVQKALIEWKKPK